MHDHHKYMMCDIIKPGNFKLIWLNCTTWDNFQVIHHLFNGTVSTAKTTQCQRSYVWWNVMGWKWVAIAYFKVLSQQLCGMTKENCWTQQFGLSLETDPFWMQVRETCPVRGCLKQTARRSSNWPDFNNLISDKCRPSKYGQCHLSQNLQALTITLYS